VRNPENRIGMEPMKVVTTGVADGSAKEFNIPGLLINSKILE